MKTRVLYFILIMLSVNICGFSAEKKIDKSQKKKPLKENVMLLYNMGSVALRKEQYDTAIIYLKEAIRLDPDYVRAYVDLGRAYCRTWNTTESLKVLKKALQLDPNNELAHLNMAEALNRARRVDEAIAECREATRINSSSINAWGVLGILYTVKGDDSAAIEALEKYAFLTEKKERETREKYGLVLHSQKAEEAFTQNCYILGQIYYKNKNYEKAIINLEKARPGYELEHYFHFLLGTCYLKTGQETDALKEYEMGLHLFPEEPSYLYNIACCYAKMGNLEKSIEWLKKAIEKYPAYKNTIQTDEDFNSIRNTPEFQELIK